MYTGEGDATGRDRAICTSQERSSMVTPGVYPKISLAVIVCAATSALLVSGPAGAGGAFLGSFEVSGDLGGTVTAIGTDYYEKSDPSSITVGMSQDIVGRTEATSGITGGSDGPGWIELATGATPDGVKLPASSEDHPFEAGQIGQYNIYFLNGPGYATRDQWTLDCAPTGGTPTSIGAYWRFHEHIKLGEVNVGDDGKIPNQPVGFHLPTGSLRDFAGESAVCISDRRGWFGNQAPITMI